MKHYFMLAQSGNLYHLGPHKTPKAALELSEWWAVEMGERISWVRLHKDTQEWFEGIQETLKLAGEKI